MKTSASSFLERHEKKIAGVLGCYDRDRDDWRSSISIARERGRRSDCGSAAVAYPAAVQNLLYERGLRCFEIGQFAEPLREVVRENAQTVESMRNSVRLRD